MKTLKFEKKLVPLVLAGTKTVTWRPFDDKDLSVGDELILINRDTKEGFANAKIISVREKKFKDIEPTDYDGHETYESNEKMIETYKGYYGDKVTGETFLKIIEFKLL